MSVLADESCAMLMSCQSCSKMNSHSASVGSVVAALTTDADGSAETDWLEWGRYRISEVQAPEHYADKLFSAELDCTENGKTYEIAATNEANPGYIRIDKTAAGSRVHRRI